jgi:hypothetical protein
MRSKFSSLVLASAALAAIALATIPAVAETSATLNVPFNFTVNGQTLPAGEYSVQRDDSGNFLKLHGKNSAQSFIWTALPGADSRERVILKFDGQGQKHVLQSIQFGPLTTVRLDKKTRHTEDMTPQTIPDGL